MQQLINILYRYPLSRIKRYHRFGGYLSYQRMLRNRQLMEIAAARLSPVRSFPLGLPLYFLTGEYYIFQTLFCIQSLSRVSSEKFNFILVDDGTFNPEIIWMVRNQIPDCTLITAEKIADNIASNLPSAQYPGLRIKRKLYPHLKKLTDIHTSGGSPWKLVLDSDMLFWKEPLQMIQWLKQPEKFLSMIDSQQSYGYSVDLMEALCRSRIKPMVNVGAIGLHSPTISWDKVERWMSTLEHEQGASYFLEQALTAMLIGEHPLIELPAKEYIVNPDEVLINQHAGILHHYVDISKKGYYSTAWKNFI